MKYILALLLCAGPVGAFELQQSANANGQDITPNSVAIGTASALGTTKLTVVASGTGQFAAINSAASGTGGGAGVTAYTSSLPSAQGHRLGFYILGYTNLTNNRNSVGIQGFADQAWTDGSAQGSYLTLETTPNGSATRTARMRIASSGDVGIGLTIPGAKLHVSSAPGASQNILLADGVEAGSPGIATTGTMAQGTLISCTLGAQTTSTGAITICVASDFTLKKDIKPLVYNPLTIDSLKPVYYRWKDSIGRGAGQRVGFIAQDVGKVIPQAVLPAGKNLKGIDPLSMVASLVLEVQELRKRVAALESKAGRP